ncbi:DUF2894 domain-containing protein [Bordetella flabilis]|uniref:DUF2894 domain-containing protein n=1 Tax=Bordetella flabilis TaxID=463014 RepID=A0A193G9D6_9BORD|nr:DUF2894 domain-containing protein [Bordetella flabilis]ANN76445.1 hypothetical protein BAU07_04320 [Bordetella flabilis]
MSSEPSSEALETLAAWRARGADRRDPVRFHFIEALARRAAAQRGEARRVLDNKLAQLLRAYEHDAAGGACGAGDAQGLGQAENVAGGDPQPGTLAGLLADLARHHAMARGAGGAEDATPDAALPPRPSYPEVPLLDEVRAVWARVSANGQLRQSLEQVPQNAGPLNSSHLVHRALSVMHELSPAYLHQFLAYADALSWMERLNAGATAPAREAQRPAPAKKSARGKAR